MKKFIRRIKALIQRIIKQFSSASQQTLPLISRPSKFTIPTVSPKWESGLVLVCSQCANERSHENSRGLTASEDLQNWIKSQLKFEGLWGKYRVVSTSCLGVCPKGRVAVVLLNHSVSSKTQCFIVDPQSDRQRLYTQIKQKN